LQREQTEQDRRAWYYHTVLTKVLHAKELRIFNLDALFQARYREVRKTLRSGTLALARHRLGDVDRPPDFEGIARAGGRSGADAVVSRLPDGYDTLLGRWFQQGQELSEGE
jgi:hypothetical protein